MLTLHVKSIYSPCSSSFHSSVGVFAIWPILQSIHHYLLSKEIQPTILNEIRISSPGVFFSFRFRIFIIVERRVTTCDILILFSNIGNNSAGRFVVVIWVMLFDIYVKKNIAMEQCEILNQGEKEGKKKNERKSYQVQCTVVCMFHASKYPTCSKHIIPSSNKSSTTHRMPNECKFASLFVLKK